MSTHEQNPWKTLGTKIVYKNPWISVREDSVICPDGSKGVYGVVDSKIATGVVALSPQNEVYLIGQFRYTIQRYSWEIVEGGAEEGEEALTAAKRELAEEAGLIADHYEALGGEVNLSNCFTSERTFIYLARGLHQTEVNRDHTEVLQVKKVPLEEALRMCDRGEINDGMSLIGLMLAARKLEGKR